MKTILFVALVLVMSEPAHAQKKYQDFALSKDSVHYGPASNDVFLPASKGYALVMPDNGKEVTGTVLILEDDKPNLSDTANIHQPANARGLATLYISTGIPIDLYFSESSLVYVDSLLKEVFSKYHLPNKNIFLVGAMVAGHRALKYIEYCKKGRSIFNPSIKGVVLCESPIDWVRQWYECQKQVRDNMGRGGSFEGNFITWLFEQHIKATPASDIQKFIDFSPYSYFDPKMEKPKLYRDLAIRAYTYADIRYWFSAQGKGIYDSNYPDMSGFINEQVLAGNKNAALIVYSSSLTEFLMNNMRKQSLTWNLIDKQELVDWMVEQTHTQP